MNSDDFEKRLQRVPLREIPSGWRENILRGAIASHQSSPVTRHSLLSTINSHLSTLLWPNPKAWVGLAAVWVLIFTIQFEARSHAPMASAANASRAATVITLKEEQTILAELMGSNEPREADKPRRLPAQPHSELRRLFSMV
jgi:hypothetical protein